MKSMIILKIAITGKLPGIWNIWKNPEDIVKWYKGHTDWNTIQASNAFKVGDSFSYTMIGKDEKSSFTLKGCYTEITDHKRISYLMENKRKVETTFNQLKDKVIIIQKIDLDKLNSKESQSLWWQTILSNFKKHAENEYYD